MAKYFYPTDASECIQQVLCSRKIEILFFGLTNSTLKTVLKSLLSFLSK
jgi:hypothetical protein